MKLISHRGNINGKTAEENKPEYIIYALDSGYDVEIDVWFIDNKWFLGHDGPDIETDIEFLSTSRLWCHAKNIEAAYELSRIGNIHFFYHQTDDITLTSKIYLWTYPDKRPLTERSVAVLPENATWTQQELKICAGICSDYIEKYVKL